VCVCCVCVCVCCVCVCGVCVCVVCVVFVCVCGVCVCVCTRTSFLVNWNRGPTGLNKPKHVFYVTMHVYNKWIKQLMANRNVLNYYFAQRNALNQTT